MAIWAEIPGETPIDDLSGLKVKSVRTRSELNAVEAQNILEAVVKYLAARPSRRLAPFDLTWTQRLHREMFGKVWSWAGRFRTRDLNLGIPWYQVPENLQNLLEDLRAWDQNGDPLMEQAARLHYRAVHIHPFVNGNGRWSRMLANIWLKQHDAEPVAWPEETIGNTSPIRDEYLAAIRRADQGDDGPLLELHARFAPK
jgi:Fic-DOC domain mobile mystery protein B